MLIALLDMEGVGSDTAIPLPNVTGKILAKVIEYCKYHLEHPTPANEDKKVNRFRNPFVN